MHLKHLLAGTNSTPFVVTASTCDQDDEGNNKGEQRKYCLSNDSIHAGVDLSKEVS